MKGNKLRGTSLFWHGVWKGCVTFKVGIRCTCVGNTVKLWEDLWIGEICLAHSFPSLNQITRVKNCLVSFQYSWTYNCRIWCVKFSNEFRDGHI